MHKYEYLLSVYYVSVTVVVTGDSVVNKTDKNPCRHGACMIVVGGEGWGHRKREGERKREQK